MGNYGFRAQLKEALSSAVSYFQDGGDPSDACVKAANDAGFTADQADRLVEAFNTARVICHYKSAEDKTSSCSLADKDVVHKGLTSTVSNEKTAEYGASDYGCYKEAEVDYVVPSVKVACAVPQDEPISKEAQAYLDVREDRVIKDLLKTAQDEARAANAMADELAEKVAMRLSRNVSIDDVHDKVARLVVGYAQDERYAPGVEKVAAFLPVTSDPDISLLKKYAARNVIYTDDLNDILPVIKQAADFVAEAAALEAYAVTLQKKAGADSVAGVQPIKTVSGALDAFKVMLADRKNSAQQRKIDNATDSVNNLRRQLILQDLLVTDKVLSQEDPDAVVAAYRSIHQVSPDSALNKEMMRSLLRSAVQSVALSPYDAKTLADIDKARRQAYNGTDTKGDE